LAGDRGSVGGLGGAAVMAEQYFPDTSDAKIVRSIDVYRRQTKIPAERAGGKEIVTDDLQAFVITTKDGEKFTFLATMADYTIHPIQEDIHG
jgi:hypothetical protein